MPSSQLDKARDYAFADRALALRKRAGLTQRDLGILLGVSEKAIGAWETGLSYPGTQHLKHLLALFLERGALGTGHEEEEAAALWASVRTKAARRTEPFDPTWFATLQTVAEGVYAAAPPPPPAAYAPTRRHDWGEAPAAPVLLGRAEELATLGSWVREGRCRVAQVVGVGGIGKTTLAARLAYETAPEFPVLYWRSLRNAPPVEEWLAGAIAALSAGQAVAPDGLQARLGLLLGLLRDQRALLVLDNLRTVLESGAAGVHYRAGYEGYGVVLARLAESAHRGCLLLTSREQPLPADDAAVRSLRLEGLGVDAGRALLANRALKGEDGDWAALVAHYAGNPLALRVVGETISVVFGGDIEAFLAQGVAVFGGVRQVLDEQLARLSALERTVLNWLAVEREPVGFAALMVNLGPGVARADAVEAVEALRRRSLLEWAPGGTFTLQPLVLEYSTTRLVETLAQEILAGEPALLVSLAVLKATARDYVRQSQERLIAQPLLTRLSAGLGAAVAVERQLLALLEAWRGQSVVEQGFGPGNAVNLLRLLRGDLRGLDLARLTLRQAYLKGVEAQGAILAGAHLSEAVLAEAFNSLMALALSADGAYVAVGTSTGEVALWRTADRTLLLALQAHASPVRCVALSGDGRLLASAGQDGPVRLWEAQGGRPLATLEGHTDVVWSVALSADGRLLASAGQDGAIRLWEAPSGRPLATLQTHILGSVALSGDGRLVASSCWDGTVGLWEAPSGRPLATLQGHTGAVFRAALSGDGHLVASAGQDGTVRLWEAASGRPLAALQGHGGPVHYVALSGDGQLVVSASYDETVRLWEAPGGRPLAILQGHTGAVWGVALSGDGRLVASASYDGTVRLWEAPGGRPLAILHGYSSEIWGVAFSADGRLVASGSQDATVRLWEASSGRLVALLRGHTGAVWGVALSADGRLVASGSYDGTVRLWEIGSGRPLATLQGHSGPVQCVALSGDGSLVASGSFDGTVRLWEAPSGRLMATLHGHTRMVYGVALSADGRLVASGSYDGTVRLWEAPSGWPLATLHGHDGLVQGVALSGDGRLVASGGSEGTIQIWEVSSSRLLANLRGHTGVVWGVALSANGRLVASGSFDGTVKLWEVASGQLLATLQGHTSVVQGVALSGDGRLLASCGQDGTVRVWMVESGEHSRTLRSDRTYERLDITGLTGVTEAQRAALLALGAVDQTLTPPALVAPRKEAAPPPSASALVSAPVPLPVQPLAAAGTPSPPPTNLPPARTTYVGRTADVANLIRALDPTMRTGARLITVTGVAGCGKTRLALAVAGAVRDAYGDGTWLVELAPLPSSPSADTTAAEAAVHAALGLQQQPGQGLPETLIAHLRPRRLLLVLDNCEHVAAACTALVVRLLGACPGLQVLATSQLPLGTAGETVWPLAALTMPDPVAGAPTEGALRLLGQSEAVQLFVERAQAVHPDFVLSAETAASVAAICRRLDGLPLAIELAAARLNVLSLEEILARLDDRFQLLRRGGRSADARHQTLQATLDWSFGLLDPAAQAVLRRLAVFSGGWELAMAEMVCAGDSVAAEAVLEVLDELLERSLVYAYEADGVPRYGMLETVRLYSLQQLERAGEAAAMWDRHLNWCAALAERAAPALQGPEQAIWLARLRREHDNLRSALQWALDRGLSTLGLRVAGGLGKFWLRGGHQGEGRRWLEALLALAADAEDNTALAARATALEGAAWLADDRHDFAQASALFDQAGALRRGLGEEGRPAGALITEGLEARASGDYARAAALLEESLVRARGLGQRERTREGDLGLALSWGNRYTLLALVVRERGEYARAGALCEECLALARKRGDAEGSGMALLSLGDIARDQGDAERVRDLCGESLTVFRGLGQKWAIGFSLNNLALAARLDGDLALAASRAEESEATFRELEAETSLAEVLVTVGRIKGVQGEAAVAGAKLAEALTLAWAKGPRLFVAAALEELGVQAIEQERGVHGVHLLAAAATLRASMGVPVRPADRPALDRALATALVALGDAAFPGAWAMGQTLPLDQVVAHALAAPEGPIEVREPAIGG
jgi:WD40 repeat protein/predicted ATPase/transcriptional regulator with XRE-family HTH domain